MVSGVSWRPLWLSCVWSLLLSAHPAWTKTLTLNFVDTNGRPVEVTKAELLLVAWAETERIELETSANSLQLVLEPDWLRSRWPQFDAQEAVFLYLQAPPLAAIRSHRFRWPVITGYGIPTVIDFPGGRQAVVKDEDASMTLAFRPTGVRRVRIVDPQGMPLRDVAVSVSMFWSTSGRCAVMTGSEYLGRRVTNADGIVEVADGDFEYALSLLGGHHVFAEGGSIPWRLLTHLTEPTTDIVAREFPIQPLKMRVWRGSEPAVGIYLRGYSALCLCGACDGPLATTDEEGGIQLDDFRPEEYRRVWLVDDDMEVWEAPTSALPNTVVEVQL